MPTATSKNGVKFGGKYPKIAAHLQSVYELMGQVEATDPVQKKAVDDERATLTALYNRLRRAGLFHSLG